ncbi:hypothetical protein GQS52_16530 [Streptomyces sp. SCUT-3]|uniref:hypothetical protein n=1 Tax=Streptomyces TaxID=1883 RepID=UPI0015F9486F|nr:hypothetical protein [Streptomyces sp. SCUT-3]QMV23114.1 hypothetical protein GQS52_16530 [Streptomyces sp. SCUT-3]
MNGPGAAPRPLPDDRVVISLRVLFCAAALLSCGLLSWVPMLRLALLRLRTVDWVLCGAVFAAAFGLLATVGELPEASPWSDAAVGALLLLSVLVTVYYLVVDIRHHGERRARAAQAAHAAHAPYGQQQYGYGYPHPQAPHPQAPPPQPGIPHQQPSPYAAPPPQAPYNPYRDTPPGGSPAGPPAPAAPAHVRPQGAPGPAAPRRMDQVRAELDELSDLLRQEEGER